MKMRTASDSSDKSAENRVSSSGDFGVEIEATFARYQQELVGALFHLLGNAEDARDAVQEAFVKCWQHRTNVGDIRCLKAWIFQVALNTGRDVRGSAWRRRRRSLPDEEVRPLVDKQTMPDADVAMQEVRENLSQAVADLREEEKEIFLLRENGDLTYEQIAETLQIPLGTVKTRMRMALANLRLAMKIVVETEETLRRGT